MCVLHATAGPRLETDRRGFMQRSIGDGAMALEEITLALFTACNSFRVVAYLPQILKAANDKNGASSISFMTWSLFLLAHMATIVRNTVRSANARIGEATFTLTTRPTPNQLQGLDLIAAIV
jgi:hypothetical protein